MPDQVTTEVHPAQRPLEAQSTEHLSPAGVLDAIAQEQENPMDLTILWEDLQHGQNTTPIEGQRNATQEQVPALTANEEMDIFANLCAWRQRPFEQDAIEQRIAAYGRRALAYMNQEFLQRPNNREFQFPISMFVQNAVEPGDEGFVLDIMSNEQVLSNTDGSTMGRLTEALDYLCRTIRSQDLNDPRVNVIAQRLLSMLELDVATSNVTSDLHYALANTGSPAAEAYLAEHASPDVMRTYRAALHSPGRPNRGYAFAWQNPHWSDRPSDDEPDYEFDADEYAEGERGEVEPPRLTQEQMQHIEQTFENWQGLSNTEQMDSLRGIATLGRRAIPALVNTMQAKIADIDVQFAISELIVASAEPGDEGVLLDILSNPHVLSNEDFSTVTELCMGLEYICDSIRHDSPTDGSLEVISERILDIVNNGPITDRAVVPMLLIALAETGTVQAFEYLQQYGDPIFLDRFDTAVSNSLNPHRISIPSWQDGMSDTDNEEDDDVYEEYINTTPLMVKSDRRTRSTSRSMTTTDVRRVLEGTGRRNGIPDMRREYEDIVAEYIGEVYKSEKKVQKHRKLIAKEDRFMAGLQEAFAGLDNLTPVEARILSSDSVALYGLVVNGGVDELYKRYTAELRASGGTLPQTDDEVTATKVQLVQGFLEQLRAKNKELEMSQMRDPITIGLEIEYVDPVYNDAKRNRNKGYVRYGDSTYRDIAGGQGRMITPLSPTGMFEESFDGSFSKEISISPVASPRTLLREVAALVKNKGVGQRLSIHQTLGGVDLTPEHTEVMDLRAISTAAGYLPHEQLTEAKINQVKQRIKDLGKEKHKKTSIVDEQDYNFPFHKRRIGADVKAYARNAPNRNPAVERRSFPKFGKGSYTGLVKDTLFSYLGAHGIRAVQQDPSLRSDRDVALMGAWNGLQEQWTQLLDLYNIHNPTNEERYDKKEKTDIAYPSTSEYPLFLSHLRVVAQENPEFRELADGIVRDYSKKVRELINY